MPWKTLFRLEKHSLDTASSHILFPSVIHVGRDLLLLIDLRTNRGLTWEASCEDELWTAGISETKTWSLKSAALLGNSQAHSGTVRHIHAHSSILGHTQAHSGPHRNTRAHSHTLKLWLLTLRSQGVFRAQNSGNAWKGHSKGGCRSITHPVSWCLLQQKKKKKIVISLF